MLEFWTFQRKLIFNASHNRTTNYFNRKSFRIYIILEKNTEVKNVLFSCFFKVKVLFKEFVVLFIYIYILKYQYIHYIRTSLKIVLFMVASTIFLTQFIFFR